MNQMSSSPFSLYLIKLSDWNAFVTLWQKKNFKKLRMGRALCNFFEFNGPDWTSVFWERNDEKALQLFKSQVNFIADEQDNR